MAGHPNVFGDEWQREMEQGSFSVRGTRVGRLAGATRVGVTVAEGEVVAFAPGRDGAHELINRGEAPARFLMLSSKALADVIEYPDSGKVSAQGGEWGTPEAIAYMLPTEPEMGYFEGEPE